MADPTVTLDPKDEFDRVLITMKAIHDKKKADYSNPLDRFSNFTYAGKAAGIPAQYTFEVLIGVKQARLIELMQPGRKANNESVEDTLLDRAIYCTLAYAHWIRDKHE